MFFLIIIVRGAPEIFPLTNLGFCPNRLDPHPPSPWRLGHRQQKKIDVYFAFQAILSILFFHENFHFFGWDWLGLIGLMH